MKDVFWTPPLCVPRGGGAQSPACSVLLLQTAADRQLVRPHENSQAGTPTPWAHTGQRPRLTNDSDTQTAGSERKCWAAGSEPGCAAARASQGSSGRKTKVFVGRDSSLHLPSAGCHLLHQFAKWCHRLYPQI